VGIEPTIPVFERPIPMSCPHIHERFIGGSFPSGHSTTLLWYRNNIANFNIHITWALHRGTVML